MRKKLDHEKINELVKSGYSYKEISELLDYNSNSVCGYCWKHFGKLEDRNKSRRQSIELTNNQKEFLFGTYWVMGIYKKQTAVLWVEQTIR